jgi:type IV pilus assembly protein PilB
VKLGQLLVKKRIIDEDQLRAVLARQKGEGARLGEMLVRLGLVSKRDVLSSLATQPGFLLDSVALAQVKPAVAQLIPRRVAERLTCIAVALDGERLSVAMADPLDFSAIEQISAITGTDVEPLLAGSSDVELAIRLHYPAESEQSLVVRNSDFSITQRQSGSLTVDGFDFDADDDRFGLVSSSRASDSLTVSSPEALESDAGELPTSVHLQNLLLHEALRERASDIHIEPRSDHLCVRNRVDGRLVESQVIPKWMHGGLISRFKVIANMDIAERRLPQDGRCRIQIEGKQIDLRVSTLPTRHGEKMVLRILDRSNQLMRLEDLGLAGEDLEALLDFIQRPQGMLLVVGPTGSGKTTTLYSVLQRMDARSQNIITIEDPIEYEIPTINQVQVQEKIGLQFSTILRSVLRQDPDVVLLGEIRDHDTAQIAVRAALTGHLLLSTLHTNNAVSTLVRLLDLEIAPFLLSSSLLGVVSQRLVRRVCPHCTVPYTPDSDALKVLGLSVAGKKYVHGAGCDACGGRGYKGRIAIFEMLRITDPMRRAIARSASEQELRRIAVDTGMTTLSDSGAAQVRNGVATAEDVAFMVRDVDWSATCPRCDGAIEPDFEVCPHCGIDLRSACPGCGKDTQPSWQTCPYCRTGLAAAVPRRPQKRLPAATADDDADGDLKQPVIRALGPAQSS